MLISEWFTAHEYLIQTMAVYAILAFSIQVAMRAGTFSLAGVGFYAIGSYAAGYLAKNGHSTIIAVGAGLVISVIIGWILARLLVRLRDLYLAMATLAFDLLIGIVALNWQQVTGGSEGLYSIPVRVSLTDILVILLVVAIVLTILESGIIGRIFEATREDEQLAQSLSIETSVYRRFAFVLSAALGSLAGALHALSSYSINPNDAGFSLITLVLSMVVIGGFISWFGALIGAVGLVWVPISLSGIGNEWPIVYGAALLLVATYVPQGLFGVLRAATRRLRSTANPQSISRLALAEGDDVA